MNFVTKFHSPSSPRVCSKCTLLFRPLMIWTRLSIFVHSLSYCVTASVFVIVRWYRNVYLLAIAYAFRPQLRFRLTLSGRTFPRKPQTFDGVDSHHTFATHAGILSCLQSTAPFDTASARKHCSSTDGITTIPKLRC